MALFQLGEFTLNSGKKSNFKIECDALEYRDWECLAALLLERLGPFKIAVGIPKGGLKLAEIMDKSATRNLEHPTLIVDDVYTTGGSFSRYIEGREGKFIGAVVFARGIVHHSWVLPLFTMEDIKTCK